MAELKNQLTWSYSRMRQFDACRRQYYYHRYLKWGGWSTDAPTESRDAYRLSKMKSLPILAGELVHKGIEEVLRRYRQNRIHVTEAEAVATAEFRWNKALGESKSGKWREDPKVFTCLLEDYYRHPLRDELAASKWECVKTSLANFYASKTWESLKASNPANWLAMDGDPFETALVEGIPIFGRPDIGYGAKSPEKGLSNCRVFDWKTGRPREQDLVQLRYYVLFAEEVWDFPHGAVKARLIYLYPEYIEKNIDVSEEALVDARMVLRNSYQNMKSVLADAENNIPLEFSYFPVTTRTTLCPHCAFQEICTDRGAPVSPTADEEEENFDD